MPDLPDWSQSVSIDAASVAIPVSGTVSITSGTVTIANASIAVINASGTKITSARPPLQLFSGAVAAGNTATGTFSGLSPDCQALVITLAFPVANYAHLKLAWHAGGANSWVPLELFSFAQQVYVIPITPGSTDHAGGLQTQLDYTFQATALGNAQIEVWELFESAPLWMQVFPQPQLEPNQLPFFIDPGQAVKNGVGAVGLALVAAVANVQIFLFEITLEYVVYGAAHVAPAWVIGHSAAIPTFNSQPTQAQTLAKRIGLDSTLYTYVFHGAPLPRGDGLWVYNLDTGDIVEVGVTINYSLG